MRRIVAVVAMLTLVVAFAMPVGPALAQEKKANPCSPEAAKKAANPCSPEAAKKATNPCNPGAVKADEKKQ